MKKNLTIKWREHGRWVKSQCRFNTKAGCERHADIIGARTFKVIKATLTPKEEVRSKHPTAFCAKLTGWIWVIDTPRRMGRAGKFLGSGKTPKAAWNKASQFL